VVGLPLITQRHKAKLNAPSEICPMTHGCERDDRDREERPPPGFSRRKPPFKFEKRCQLFVGGNDEPVSIVAMHANIAFDFVELKLDGVMHDS
jgi:hypothetical protein